ncbi:e3 ubiquitin-protein ligase-like protein [Dermatophagoides farinae]|uniref:RCR-type E3 ubiquitin transferase n=1 Tax=Dermatophagoides farinae TaxID=6954 RepID=A0A9D4SM98_DERFA|nr:e3 ubiquitin-protein ligase-like protein [Dermatophagoides farinae]
MLKFISEFHACTMGFISMESDNNERKNLFQPQNEFSTPSRFCRRSSTKCWNTGSGSPEAICFSINKPDIYISGVRVYTSTVAQFKYQLQLLDQAFDDNRMENNFKWKKIATISGVYYQDDNHCNNRLLNDLCEIRFERPIPLLVNVKYALVFKNHSQYSYSGDMGLAQVRCDDDTIFTFMDCSLSKNGTNLNRGQIPQILYYNVPPSSSSLKSTYGQQHSFNNSYMFNVNEAHKSVILMFLMAIDNCKELLGSLIESIENKTTKESIIDGTHQSSTCESDDSGSNDDKSFNNNHISSTTTTTFIDWKILTLLNQIFDSIFFREFLPITMIYMKMLKFHPSCLHILAISLRNLIELISRLNRLIHEHFDHKNFQNHHHELKRKFPRENTHHIIVESDHPYKSATVTSHLIRFPPNIKFMTIEFDRKCCTAQPEDYLEIYIPKEYLQNFNINFDYKNNDDNDRSTSLLSPIYHRFSCKDFNDMNDKIEKSKFSPEKIKNGSHCLFIPGNEMTLMLKTSSDYVHSSIVDSNYGFKAEIIGYELPGVKSVNDLMNFENLDQHTMFYYIDHMIQMFECNTINLFGSIIDSLMNCSPMEIMLENSIIDKHQDKLIVKKYSESDLKQAEQIFEENSNLLQKGFDIEPSLLTKIKTIDDLFDNIQPNIHPFLDDFIQLNIDTSGARLALWLQNEAFILPNSCLMNIIINDNNEYFGQKILIKILTRDQHEEIAYDPNACIEIQVRFISFNSSSSSLLIDDTIVNQPESTVLPNESTSSISQIISQNQYQITVKDKTRYHSITMMKMFENYSLEELRMECPAELFHGKKPQDKLASSSSNDLSTITLQSFNNGYYLACWSPTSIGSYRIEMMVDGEKSENSVIINVNNCVDDSKFSYKNNNVQPIIHHHHKDHNRISNNSAGLRIRSLPSLQSEQIGIISINGLLTIIDQLENDDGIWVRLSNESIQAYSTSNTISICDGNTATNNNAIAIVGGQLLCKNQLSNNNNPKDFYMIDNFQESKNADDNNTMVMSSITNNKQQQQQQFIDNNMKHSSATTFTMRTEAWALQFNKHFNRTLLMAIDSEDKLNNDDIDVDDGGRNKSRYLSIESLIVPGWFQVIMCDNNDDGHIIRNWPSLDDISIIIGIIPLNDIVYAVEIVQNEFGYWIRLSQDSLQLYMNTLYRSSSVFDNNLEAWLLLQSIDGLIYLQNNIQQNYLTSTIMIDEQKDCKNGGQNQCHHHYSNNNNKYNNDSTCDLPIRMAISNRSAQCIRAIFAAFIWHEGILNDFLTAASYLKFNADITKDFIRQSNQIDLTKDNSQHQQQQQQQPQNNAKTKIRRTTDRGLREKNVDRRHQKIIFRHSVEVSQLISLYRTSDVNSNVNFLENNNNIQNSVDNNENHHRNDDNNMIIDVNDQTPTVDDDDDDDEQTGTIPEILINLLQIWEFVSTECLRQISSIRNHKNLVVTSKLTELKLLVNNDEKPDEDKYSKQQLYNRQSDDLLITTQTHKQQCECDETTSMDLNKNSQNDMKQDTVIWAKQTTDNLYQSLMANVDFLLSLTPSNDENTSATAMGMDKIPLATEILNRNLFDQFTVITNTILPIHLLNDRSIRKSIYEQRLAEENRLSDLAIICDDDDDHQHLLSPDICSFDNFGNNESIHSHHQPAQMKKKKPIKFYRSISVGMNDQHGQNYGLNKCHLVVKPADYDQTNSSSSSDLVAKKSIKSNETLCLDSKQQKINMPFLCKPSSKLIDLIAKFQPKMESESQQQQLICSDVIKFIFTCSNIDSYNLLVKYSLCSSAYRSLALAIINWLLINASNLHSIHDLMWIFVNSLLPKDDSETFPDNNNDDVANNIDKNGKCKSLKSYGNHDDVCRHPFDNLKMAGELANHWISESLHRLMRSISNLLPLLPMGSPLQRMAIRCFGMEFTSNDHNFLHECKVFSHISTILTRSSIEMDNNNFIHCHTDLSKMNVSTWPKDENELAVMITKDLTHLFDLRTSSRHTMISSLNDNSTETFWESGNEDRNKIKFIHIQRNADYAKQIQNDNNANLRFICIYVDNTRDLEYRISHISWKICGDNKIADSAIMLRNNCPESNNFLNATINEYEKLKTIEVDSKFCGWLQCELSAEQSYDLFNANDDRYILIEMNGPFPCLRVRQIKMLATIDTNDSLNQLPESNRFMILNSRQVQTTYCELETLRVFRLLTSQVFGKLLSNDQSFNNNENNNNNNDKTKRTSLYSNNENNLREHMVGILFSQSGKLSELQRQVCTHIVKEIHYESRRVFDEWETMLLLLSSNNNNNNNNNNENQAKNYDETNEIIIPNDCYCFELLSLVLALSGSNVGREYLSEQLELLNDILTLLHTSSDRVKRQVLSLIRRVIPRIKPEIFAKLLDGDGVPTNNDNNYCSFTGILDIFLTCIAKSLTIQIKIKGNRSSSSSSSSRYEQSIYRMNTIYIDCNYDGRQQQQQKRWLKGNQSKQIGQSIIGLIKDMCTGLFGQEWCEIARYCLVENILKLTELDENIRNSDKCIESSLLWMALASLCVIDEKDVEKLSTNNLYNKHNHHNDDKTNGNSSSQHYCDNHDDGETIASIQCNICGHLCIDCDRFLHLNTAKTRTHKRHMFKDDCDSLKVDIHEGCGRVKFFRSLIVADLKLLKIMIEFRQNNYRSEHGDNQTLDNNSMLMQNNNNQQRICRFCSIEYQPIDDEIICKNEDCQRHVLQACTRTLNCGHFCCGIRDESPCLPCLNGCTSDLKQDGDDMCMICFSESLFSAPCIQLVCYHIFHYDCVKTVLEKRWSGGRITFTFSLCPICKIPIDHQSLSELLEPIHKLYEDVRRKSLMRLEFEGLKQCEAITAPNARFYQDPTGFAMERYSYYLCFKCQKAYYGGEARCDIEYDGNNYNPQELICGSCSDVTQAQICPKHGTDFLEYKCRFCCSVAVYFCFGSTHFCNACHDDFQRLISLKEYPQCPVGPHSIPIDDCDECPLHVQHPPTGQEFALGCGICRNTHTF